MDPTANTDLIDRLRRDWSQVCPSVDTTGMELEGRLMRLGRILEQKTMDALKPFDLHYTDFDVLATLRRSGSPYRMTPTELLDSVVLTSGAMTAVLKRLDQAGWIERRASEEDKRVRAVVLTRAGRALTDKAAAARFKSASSTSSLIPRRDRKQLADRLRALLLAIEAE